MLSAALGAKHPKEGAVTPAPPGDSRQEALTGVLRCYYDEPRHRALRPHCQGLAVVAYGPTRLYAMCDAMRSAVGKATVPRAVPGAELGALIDAARAATAAERQLGHAAHAARAAGASWSQIGDALGLSRQAAQQRWGRH